MVVVQDNIANKPMHNEPYVVGLLTPPDSHYNPQLYSHYQATKEFNQLDRDIYEQTAQHKPADRKKTPVSILCLSGAAALFGLFKLAKHFIKK